MRLKKKEEETEEEISHLSHFDLPFMIKKASHIEPHHMFSSAAKCVANSTSKYVHESQFKTTST